MMFSQKGVDVDGTQSYQADIDDIRPDMPITAYDSYPAIVLTKSMPSCWTDSELIKAGLQINGYLCVRLVCETHMPIHLAHEHIGSRPHRKKLKKKEDEQKPVKRTKGRPPLNSVDIPVHLPGGKAVGAVVIDKNATWQQIAADWHGRDSSMHLLPPIDARTGRASDWNAFTAVFPTPAMPEIDSSDTAYQ